MASRETIDLRNIGGDQLERELETAHQALFNLRFQTATRQLADVSQVHKARRRIARLKTLIRERAILEEHDRMMAATSAAAEGTER